jgi:RNA polymerase sigma factor (sigma-70 family)
MSQERGRRPREDEPASFERFFDAEALTLFRRLCVITGLQVEAEEIMQEAFLAIWQRWDRVSVMDDPVGYLYRTAMNVFRSRARRARLAIRKTVSMAEPADPFAGIDERADLLAALRALTPRQRAAFVLTDGLGYSSEDAAAALGVTAGTVRGLASRARAALRSTEEGARA